MTLFSIIFISSIGACVGSFTHLIIYRYSPQQPIVAFLANIMYQRSFCPICLKRLPLSSLIPIFSWLIQRGKCQYCSHYIPYSYPLAEIFCAIFFLTISGFYGVTEWSFALITLGLLFYILAIIDIRYYLLPDIFIIPIFILGLIYSGIGWSHIVYIDALIGVLCGSLLLGGPAICYFYVTKREGIGLGDIKLLATLGVWIHYQQLPLLLLMASLLGIIYFIVSHGKNITYLLNRQLLQTHKIPFGPFILFAAYIILLTY